MSIRINSQAHEHPAAGMAGAMHAHTGHGEHVAMVADFLRRFWLRLALTPPVLLLSPMIQHELGLGDALRFRGDGLVLYALSSFIYVYGGQPFLTGFLAEFRIRMARWSDNPGVANLGHHTRHHVVEIVAVKCPAAGIVRVERDGDAAHRRH
jgi:hypothetical protein